MSLICGCYTPLEDFIDYFKSFLAKQKDEKFIAYARYMDYLLLRTLARGTRKYPPCMEEIHYVKRAATLTQKPILCRITTLDGTSKAIYVDPKTSVAEAFLDLTTRLGIRDLDGFCITESYPSYERRLKDSENVCDLLASWEMEKSKNKLKESPKFIFKKRHWVDFNMKPSEDPITFNLLYHQAVNDVVKGYFPYNIEEAGKLAAYQLQITHGDSSSKKQVITAYVITKIFLV